MNFFFLNALLKPKSLHDFVHREISFHSFNKNASAEVTFAAFRLFVTSQNEQRNVQMRWPPVSVGVAKILCDSTKL